MQQNERTLANGSGHSGMLGQLAKTFALDFAACEQPAPFTLLPVPALGVSIGMERRWQASKWHALRAPPDRDGLTVLLSFLHPHSTSNWLLLPSCARTDHGAAFPARFADSAPAHRVLRAHIRVRLRRRVCSPPPLPYLSTRC